MKKIVCAILILSMCLISSACSVLDSEYYDEEIPTSAILTEEGKALKEALGNVLNAPILEVDTEGIETPAFLRSIESRNGYEILSFETTQTGAVATMRVFAPDVYGVAKDLDSNNTYTDENVLADVLDSALKVAPIVEKQVVMEYILTEEGYAPLLNVDFLDAYYGGIYQLRDEMIENAVTEG